VITASDVIDDLIDAVQPSSEDSRLQINAALALSQLAQCCLLPLAAQVGPERAHRISMLLAQRALISSAGQDLDLRLERRVDADEDQAHHMTVLKSGALLAMACLAGAALATDDADVLALVGAFGEHVGVVAQLLNDIAGINPRHPRLSTDLALRKKTLPLCYALRCAQDEGIADLLAWASTDAPLAHAHEQQLAKEIDRLGASHYAWVVADVHRREALALVRRLVRSTRQPTVARLRRLVPTLQA
jgi:geranylgeranyl pyrophosphate synthase